MKIPVDVWLRAPTSPHDGVDGPVVPCGVDGRGRPVGAGAMLRAMDRQNHRTARSAQSRYRVWAGS
jgi:hypothetical protein